MLLFALVFLTIWAVLTGAGIALGFVACALAIILLGFGVLSSSIAIGFRRSRVSSGVRALLFQCGVLAGIPAGAFCALLAESLFQKLGATHIKMVAYGAMGGAISGMVVALFLDFAVQRTVTFAVEHCMGRKARLLGDFL